MNKVCRSLVALLAPVLIASNCPAQVFINEVCARNGGAFLTPAGSAPDYVELFNTSTSPVSLSGWSLTDNSKTPAKFVFPGGVTIPGRSYLVVHLDSRNDYPGVVSTNFTLSGSGEVVQLYQGLTLRDSITFGPQVQDRALCRIPDGTGGWQLASMTPGTANAALPASAFGVPSALRVNEWMATNSAGADFDWLELFNPKSNGIVALAGLVITDQPSGITTAAITQHSYIGSGDFLRYWCDSETGEDHLPFRLSSTSGESISIFLSDKVTLVDRVSFGPQQANVSMGRLPDGGTNFIFFAGADASPEEPNKYRDLPVLVVNEVLAHTDPPLEDAIEFYNPSVAPVDISHWWMSNDPDNPYKFRVPAGSVVPANGFLVFYEQNQFNGFSSTPGFNRSGTGDAPDFSLNSAHGDAVALFEALPNGALTGLRLTRSFGESANGVSFGRYVKSDGGTDLAPMSARTLGVDSPSTVTQFRTGTGKANAEPLIGPVVLSEIFFQPQPIIENGVTNDNTLDEFVEVSNLGTQPVLLFDPQYPTNNWRLRGGVDFTFPNSTLAAGASVLVVNFDPQTNLTQLASFRSKYNVPLSVPIYGPYGGKLNNASDTVELQKPDPVQLPPHPDAGYVPYPLVEKVKYENGAGWPTNANGTGLSLQRRLPATYANDQVAWISGMPTPGLAAGSLPSPIVLLNPQTRDGHFEFAFESQAGRAYTVESSTSLAVGSWQVLTNVTGNGSTLTIRDPRSSTSAKSYRVRQ